MLLSKLEIARRQLDTAINLYFDDSDAVSVHSLASNAREIIEGLCKERGISSFKDGVRQNFGVTQKEYADTINLYRNEFKHPEEKVDYSDFSDAHNEYLIIAAIHSFYQLNKSLTIPMQIFEEYFFRIHADIRPVMFDPIACERLFPAAIDDNSKLRKIAKGWIVIGKDIPQIINSELTFK